MANQIFSFTSYILSELGHRDKLVDVSVWWSDLIQEYMKFMIDFWLWFYAVAQKWCTQWPLQWNDWSVESTEQKRCSDTVCHRRCHLQYLWSSMNSFIHLSNRKWFIIFSMYSQRFHEFYIRQTQPEIKVLRKTLTEIHEQATLGPNLELIM